MPAASERSKNSKITCKFCSIRFKINRSMFFSFSSSVAGKWSGCIGVGGGDGDAIVSFDCCSFFSGDGDDGGVSAPGTIVLVVSILSVVCGVIGFKVVSCLSLSAAPVMSGLSGDSFSLLAGLIKFSSLLTVDSLLDEGCMSELGVAFNFRLFDGAAASSKTNSPVKK